MKIVIAPDSFKESLPASEVAKAIKRGLQKALPESECLLLPVGDGGEGTVESLIDGTNGKIYNEETLNPLGEKIISKKIFKKTF